MRGLTALFLLALMGCAAMSAPASESLPACTAERVERFEPCDWRSLNAQRRPASLATLAPVAGSEGEACRASITQTERNGEVFFAVTLPCHNACGARAPPDGVYRLRRRD